VSRSAAKRRAASPTTPTAATTPATATPSAPLSPAGLGARLARSGWLPAVLVAAATGALLLAFDVSPLDLGRFAAWVGLGIALPGVAWVRVLRGRAAHIAEDVALGLVLGYALEIAVYLVARAAGVPLLVLALPVGTCAVVGLVPSFRARLRGHAEAAPLAWSWAIALIVLLVVVYSAATVFTALPLASTHSPHVDLAFHLALIGELRNHVPPMIPYVTGEPLAYHWLFYAEAAATSHATGIEPQVLLYRLEILPMLIAFVVLTAMAARRLVRGWWAGPVAVAIVLFGAVAEPYGWLRAPVYESQTLIATWTSPTNAFGLVALAAVLVMVLDHLGKRRPARGEWLLATLLVLLAAGAKASTTPLLAAGLVAVCAGLLATRRRVPRVAIAWLGLVLGALALAAIVLFRGSLGGARLGTSSILDLPVRVATGTVHTGGLSGIGLTLLALGVLALLWACLWGASLALLRRHAVERVPRLLLLAGAAAGAVGAALLLSYPGMSQLYYLRGATGVLGLLAVAGLDALTAKLDRRSRPLLAAMAAFAVAGAAVAILAAVLSPSEGPTAALNGIGSVAIAIALPAIELTLALVAGFGIARLAAGRFTALRGAAVVLVVALAMGFGLPASVRTVLDPSDTSAHDLISSDGIAAARWLRDHSRPDDLVATNLHCLPTTSTTELCDARHFWVSAYSERRVLVEGWAYTTTAFTTPAKSGQSDRTIPFWNLPLLQQNELAFASPSQANVGGLRDLFGVRWLFADLAGVDPKALAAAATVRFEAGEFAVLEIP
jgi:hypothetical protein